MIQIDKKEMKKALNTLMFPNRSNEEIANYVSYNHRFLWRRDSYRLVAIIMDKKHTEGLNYNIADLTVDEKIEDLTLEENNNLILKLQDEKTKIINPISKENNTIKSESLKTLQTKEFEIEFSIKSQFLTMQLAIINNKLINKNIDINKATVELDFKNKKFRIKEIEEGLELPIKIEKGEKANVSYTFSLFKDLLANSINYNSSISFKLSKNNYTIIRYNKYLVSVLMHKIKS